MAVCAEVPTPGADPKMGRWSRTQPTPVAFYGSPDARTTKMLSDPEPKHDNLQKILNYII